MPRALKRPRLRQARPRANPTLETIELVLAVLRSARAPVRRDVFLAALARWGHPVTRRSLDAVIAFLGEIGAVAEGSKGPHLGPGGV